MALFPRQNEKSKNPIFFIPPAFSASEKALSDAVLATVTPSSDCAINSVKMNATFSLSLHFCHIHRPHPHGITVVSVPITTVLPLTLSPFPQYYRNFIPHYRGFTAVTADLPLSPSSCSSPLRDTESTTCVVESSLVKPEQMTGSYELCMLIDGNVKKYPTVSWSQRSR